MTGTDMPRGVTLAKRESRTIPVGGLDMHYLEQGSGPPMLLLHGFPDHAAAWRPLADRMAPTFRLIAPDLRGYGRTSRPGSVADYRLDLLVGDVVALLDALDIPRAYICGHDWGGVLAFAVEERHPARVAGLIALNAAPPAVFQHLIWHDADQRLASQYIRFLRSTEADAVFKEANVEALLDRFLSAPRQAGQIDEADLEAYREAWTGSGVWQAMLAWYRAAPFDVPAVDACAPLPASVLAPLIETPALILWGDQDTVFVPAMAEAAAQACRDARLERLADAGHVPHRDAPARCAQLITAFVAQHPLLPDEKVELS
ncbi:alpha/beta hydrolase [Sphingopyxis sp. YF1]|uniref:alpha/beta hydrolase n=1 Tax=unclassified Sphingopyxis TaxID=2614943 RepID=UPI001F61CAC5|nr:MULTISPECIES: alpha/beta hydrolase [unclassified Sphingopyxis]UNU44677.1 alpha/beta hydrolase [Sphingopyxis sp. YF1]USI76580.1 alpha/beta hydrolase [Sphingopyxis sp. USTB-05]